MCDFFSFVTDGEKRYYFDWALRQKCLSGELNYNPDSHTSIADYFGFKGAKEDALNKYEYNPLTGEFTVDQLNTKDDRLSAEAFAQGLDFKTVVEPLIIKPIVHPFTIVNDLEQRDIDNMKKWIRVWGSVWGSVRDSVRGSVWGSVRDSVRGSVGASVGASVRDSVWGSVGDSVGDSVRDSVRGSVWASVGAYISSFFDIKYKYDFSPCVKLWERGFVPSFDGKTWRLHGENGIVYEEADNG